MVKGREETVEERQKRLRDRELSDIRALLAMPEGRRVFWRVLEHAKTLNSPYVHGDNGYSTAFNSGRQNEGLWLFSELNTAKPNAFSQMQKDHNSEKTRDDKIEEKQIENKDILNMED